MKLRPILAIGATALALPLLADSPLVEAAKRSNRLGKAPANVITNETVAMSTGKLSRGNASGDDQKTENAQAPANAAKPAAPAAPAAAATSPAPARPSTPQPAVTTNRGSYESSSRVSSTTLQQTAGNAAAGSTASNGMPQSTVRSSNLTTSATSSALGGSATSSNPAAVPPKRVD